MSQNVIEEIKKIFRRLESVIDEDEAYRIKSIQRGIKIEEEYKPDAFDVVSNAIIKIVRTNDYYEIFSVRYKDEIYVVLPEEYLQIVEIIDLIEVDNNGIKQGIGILSMSSNCTNIREGLSCLELIDRCFELEPENHTGYVEISYNQVSDFFDKFFVARFENSNFKVNYTEDFLRMYGIALTIKNRSMLSEKTYEELRGILFLESSRSIATSIINIMQSSRREHKFLHLYQCIEYLFIIYNALNISLKYSISKSNAVEMIINENFKVAEISNVVSIIGHQASESSIINYFKNVIGEDPYENTTEKVCNHIYKVRCNIAHLRYKQDNLLVSITWESVMEYLANIVMSIYQKMDNDIALLCTETKSWELYE